MKLLRKTGDVWWKNSSHKSAVADRYLAWLNVAFPIPRESLFPTPSDYVLQSSIENQIELMIWSLSWVTSAIFIQMDTHPLGHWLGLCRPWGLPCMPLPPPWERGAHHGLSRQRSPWRGQNEAHISERSISHLFQSGAFSSGLSGIFRPHAVADTKSGSWPWRREACPFSQTPRVLNAMPLSQAHDHGSSSLWFPRSRNLSCGPCTS